MLTTILCAVLTITQDPGAEKPPPPPPPRFTQAEIAVAGKVIGIVFTDHELELMAPTVSDACSGYERVWKSQLDNSIAPAFAFHSRLPGMLSRPLGMQPVKRTLPMAKMPQIHEELAYADIPTLASLLRSHEVSCAELTELALARLKRLDPKLHCVVTLCEARARAQAVVLDDEIRQGKWRGPLHGIPWGAKDLLATKGVRTTWGAKPFENQMLDVDAAVVEKLDAAGAVLVAKLSLGELAMDDVWFGGKTRNPWKLEEGSSGSSAGPAAAVAAGCVAFAIGSETCGSIVSPSARCGCSSLRPTFGRVSRYGAMALSWTMDKLGPLCRSVEDAAIVFGAITGGDERDESSLCEKNSPDASFVDLGPVDVHAFKVGYTKGAWRNKKDEEVVLLKLKELGIEAVPLELPKYPVQDLMCILLAEAATAFDELTRSGQDDLLARQEANAWPDVFRAARLIPAVEYLRASRIRRELMQDTHKALMAVDVLVHPSLDDDLLVRFNLTGQPTVTIPFGWRDDGTPRSIGFTANLFDEAHALAFAEAWQRATEDHKKHPKL